MNLKNLFQVCNAFDLENAEFQLQVEVFKAKPWKEKALMAQGNL